MITRGDRILTILLFVASVGAMILLNRFMLRENATSVIIEVDGKCYAQYSLKEIHEPNRVEIETEYGYNLLLLEQGQVSVLESSCKDKLEIHAGVIKRAGQQLICLPNRLVVRLDGKDEYIDGVTY